jgi:hypothetical protein
MDCFFVPHRNDQEEHFGNVITEELFATKQSHKRN